jgi:hypothetical protein
VSASSDRLRIVCTDRGNHASRDIGLIHWTPEVEGGGAVWDPGDDPSQLTASSMGETVRRAGSGVNHVTERTPIEARIRRDGGVTFVLPPCPTCGPKSAHTLRDDTLAKCFRALADTPGARLDISLIP